jgi:hypothetical protein
MNDPIEIIITDGPNAKTTISEQVIGNKMVTEIFYNTREKNGLIVRFIDYHFDSRAPYIKISLYDGIDFKVQRTTVLKRNVLITIQTRRDNTELIQALKNVGIDKNQIFY